MIERLAGSLSRAFRLVVCSGMRSGRRVDHGETETRQLSPPGRNARVEKVEARTKLSKGCRGTRRGFGGDNRELLLVEREAYRGVTRRSCMTLGSTPARASLPNRQLGGAHRLHARRSLLTIPPSARIRCKMAKGKASNPVDAYST